jgi:hypothetical protein
VNPARHTLPASREDSNPFATRWVRPGAIPYVFPAGVDADSLAAKLASQHYWGEITGPHGSGKSSLIQALNEALRRRNRRVELYTLRAGPPRLTLRGGQPADWGGDTQIVVDGYEQLGWRRQGQLQRLCRRRGAGLLITAHRSAGLPLLWPAGTSLALAQHIVAQLVRAEPGVIRAVDVARCYASCNGNLRDVFFDLYDLWERRRSC